jgi:hypothetical protein
VHLERHRPHGPRGSRGDQPTQPAGPAQRSIGPTQRHADVGSVASEHPGDLDGEQHRRRPGERDTAEVIEETAPRRHVPGVIRIEDQHPLAAGQGPQTVRLQRGSPN